MCIYIVYEADKFECYGKDLFGICPDVIRFHWMNHLFCPCKVYPLEPHFYITKLGYGGLYLFFLFLIQNIDCGYSLEAPHRGGSNVYPQSMF